MGKTANGMQAARLKARQRRIALDVDREARDGRIEDTAVKVFGLLDERASAEEAIADANVAIGAALRLLIAEELNAEAIALLVDLDASEVRRLTRSAQAGKRPEKAAGAGVGASVTQLNGEAAASAARRAV
jgi:hypothetical protein